MSRAVVDSPRGARPGKAGIVYPLLASLVVLAFDWVSHPFLFKGYGRQAVLTYVGTALLSAAMWWAWASLVAHRSRAACIAGTLFLVVLGTTLVGGQRYVVDRYGVLVDKSYVSGGVTGYGNASTVLWNDKWTLLRAVLPPLVGLGLVAFFLLRVRRRITPVPARITAPIAIVTTIVSVAFASPSRYAEGAEPLDILGLAAIGEAARVGFKGNAWAIPGRRHPTPVPALVRDPAVPARNVLLVVTESVRAASTCLDVRSACPMTPFSHKALPERLVFPNMHALASTTAPATVVLWTGLTPGTSRDDLHAAPLVWEYARAAGFDSAYWAAQDLTFGNMQMFFDGLPAGHFVSAAELDRDRDSLVGADEHKLSAHVEAHVAELREPFVAVVHLSNTHMPYRVDPDDLPWVPQSSEGGSGHEVEVYNRYRDAIYAQDKQLTRVIKAFRGTAAGARTVILYTSDHGEQFREHGTTGHSNTLSEPEVRVPFWVDAPPSTLTVPEREMLASAVLRPMTSVVVLPTMLDLMGLYDLPAIAAMRAAMPGTSLLRALPPGPAPVLLTNCSPMAACLRPTWGAMAGPMKVWANDKDVAWNCHDVVADPDEKVALHGDACDALGKYAEGSGRGAPFHGLR